jgi:hypothetical protein
LPRFAVGEGDLVPQFVQPGVPVGARVDLLNPPLELAITISIAPDHSASDIRPRQSLQRYSPDRRPVLY